MITELKFCLNPFKYEFLFHFYYSKLHVISIFSPSPYLGDNRLPAYNTEQPGTHKLPRVHVNHIEVKETAPRAQGPDAHPDVLNSLSRQSENITWINLEQTDRGALDNQESSNT